MKPKGFWSYARGDDKHLDGALGKLRSRVEGEVSMLLGHDVDIFQDIRDLRTGDLWADKLRAQLTDASFLIPVLSPRFFNRPWCREEVLRYLELSKEEGIAPRIFPILLVGYDDDADCEVRAALEPFQYKDMTQWRFESDPTRKARMLHDFAKDVKSRLAMPVEPSRTKTAPAEPAPEQEQASQSEAAKPAQVAAPHKSYVVDQMARGDFTSIMEAIDAAEPGSKIIVREGTYREEVKLTKPIELVGEGDRDRILVTTDRGNALFSDVSMSRVQGIRFRRESGGGNSCAYVTGGGVIIEDCTFESHSLSGLEVSGSNSSPTIRGCSIISSAEVGFLLSDGAKPTIEGCEVENTQYASIEVKDSGTLADIRDCVFRDSRTGGIHLHSEAEVRFQNCDILGNGYSGVSVMENAKAELGECRILGNSQAGVFIKLAGTARLEKCQVSNNGYAGVDISESGSIGMFNCSITDNKREAIRIRDANGTGLFHGNNLLGNGCGSWNIADGAMVVDENNKV